MISKKDLENAFGNKQILERIGRKDIQNQLYSKQELERIGGKQKINLKKPHSTLSKQQQARR